MITEVKYRDLIRVNKPDGTHTFLFCTGINNFDSFNFVFKVNHKPVHCTLTLKELQDADAQLLKPRIRSLNSYAKNRAKLEKKDFYMLKENEVVLNKPFRLDGKYSDIYHIQSVDKVYANIIDYSIYITPELTDTGNFWRHRKCLHTIDEHFNVNKHIAYILVANTKTSIEYNEETRDMQFFKNKRYVVGKLENQYPDISTDEDDMALIKKRVVTLLTQIKSFFGKKMLKHPEFIFEVFSEQKKENNQTIRTLV